MIVFVDRQIEGFSALETQLLEVVKAALKGAGLSSDSPIDLTLSVEARTYPGGNLTPPGVELVSVQVVLREPVQLSRDPKLKIAGGNGAVTWSSGWTFLERKIDLAAAIERAVLSQVQDFAADVGAANK